MDLRNRLKQLNVAHLLIVVFLLYTLVRLFYFFFLPIAETTIGGFVVSFFLKATEVLVTWSFRAFDFLLLFSVLYLFMGRMIKNTNFRTLLLLSLVVVIDVLDSSGYFGRFAWDQVPEYAKRKMQFISFYYFAFLLVLPRMMWGWANAILVAFLSILGAALSIVPVVGAALSIVLSSGAVFCMFIVSTFAGLTLFAEKRMDMYAMKRKEAMAIEKAEGKRQRRN